MTLIVELEVHEGDGNVLDPAAVSVDDMLLEVHKGDGNVLDPAGMVLRHGSLN